MAQGSIPEDPNKWVARYNGPANSGDYAKFIAVSPDGSKVFVTGISYGSGSNEDYATVAYSAATGAQVWVARYSGPGNSFDVVSSIVVSPDGSTVFVTGSTATFAYSAAAGDQLWAADGGGSLAVSPDGSKIFLTRESATLAYSAATGAQIWAAPHSSVSARDLAVSPDGSKIFVTGISLDSSFRRDYATLAYSAATGADLWAAHYNGPENFDDDVNSLAVSPDSSTVFVTGTSFGSSSHIDYATLAYSAATGVQLWAARYNGPGNSADYAHSLAVSPDGSKVFVTGSSLGTGSISYDYATLAYSAATGAEVWAARYSGPGSDNDFARSLGVSPDGTKIFVTGSSTALGINFEDYATLAYSAVTGAELWAARYNGPANTWDSAYSLAVSPDGSTLFVTETSTASGSFEDYATIAYPAVSTCANGKDEGGPVSGVVHETVEPQGGPGAPYVHGVNCDVVAANGL